MTIITLDSNCFTWLETFVKQYILHDSPNAQRIFLAWMFSFAIDIDGWSRSSHECTFNLLSVYNILTFCINKKKINLRCIVRIGVNNFFIISKKTLRKFFIRQLFIYVSISLECVCTLAYKEKFKLYIIHFSSPWQFSIKNSSYVV